MTTYGIQQLQLGSILRNEDSAERALRELGAAGFRHIELDGFMIHKTPMIARALLTLSGMGIKRSQSLDWKSLLNKSSLSPISIHEDLKTLEENFFLVQEDIATYGPKYVVLTGLYRFPYDDEEEIGKLIVRLNRLGRKLKSEGVSFLYHNHSVEFQRLSPESTVLQMLLEGLNPDWVNFEFDSYWALDAGADPLSWMDKLGSRIKLYHICDRGCRKKGPYMTPILKADAIELGSGSMNIAAYAEKAISLGVDAIILEQHRNYAGKDPILSARVSADWLKKHLL
ncbi:MAG: TIM barrel protein [Bacilli bacterium]|nr:TIM barrel protein [Bacilli bacterium]